MEKEITIYYIPKNPNIIKGRIYTLYINNNTNLELSSILKSRNTTTNDKKQTLNSIIISEKDYTRLLELNNITYQLTNRSSKDIQNFLNEELKTIGELAKINTERQELIKKITRKEERKIWTIMQKYPQFLQMVQK